MQPYEDDEEEEEEEEGNGANDGDDENDGKGAGDQDKGEVSKEAGGDDAKARRKRDPREGIRRSSAVVTFRSRSKAKRFIKSVAGSFALVQCGRAAHAVLVPSNAMTTSEPAKIKAGSSILRSLFRALVEALGLPESAMRLVHRGSVFYGSRDTGSASDRGDDGSGGVSDRGCIEGSIAASAANAAGASTSKPVAILTLLFTSAYHDAEAVRQVLRELDPTLSKLEKEAEIAARKQKHRAVAVGGGDEALLRLRLLHANAVGVRDTLQAMNGTRSADWRRGVRAGTLGETERELQKKLCGRAVKLCELLASLSARSEDTR